MFIRNSFILIAAMSFSAPSLSAEDDIQKQILRQLLLLQTDLNGLKRNLSALHQKIDSMAGGTAGTELTYSDLPDKILLREFSTLGSDTAKVAIIEFSDYECPYCAKHAAETLPEIRRSLVEVGLVKYDIQDFPLSIHPKALGAAVAANCAGLQGKYWEMHDLLNANFSGLDPGLYSNAAGRLGLDSDAFESCRNDPVQQEAVNAGALYAQSLGVSGTPSFFIGRINGDEITDVIFVEGVRDAAYFVNVVNQISAE